MDPYNQNAMRMIEPYVQDLVNRQITNALTTAISADNGCIKEAIKVAIADHAAKSVGQTEGTVHPGA